VTVPAGEPTALGGLITFKRLEILSFCHSAIYLSLLAVWLIPGLPLLACLLIGLTGSRLKGLAHIPAIIARLSDSDPSVVRAARAALKTVTGEDFGPPADATR